MNCINSEYTVLFYAVYWTLFSDGLHWLSWLLEEWYAYYHLRPLFWCWFTLPANSDTWNNFFERQEHLHFLWYAFFYNCWVFVRTLMILAVSDLGNVVCGSRARELVPLHHVLLHRWKLWWSNFCVLQTTFIW